MRFREKLFKIRKEKNLSQEALAEQLGTTRQAISKWENGQGYPETEKLLLLSNIFEVSVDYLLKDTPEKTSENKQGYYVSREMAEGYLLNQIKTAKRLALALSIIILATIPYFIYPQSSTEWLFPTIIIAIIGVALLVTVGFMDEDRYNILKKEILIFDQNYIKEIKNKYQGIKRRYLPIGIICACLICTAVVPLLVVDNQLIKESSIAPYYPVCIFFWCYRCLFTCSYDNSFRCVCTFS